ncbi:hypothetical protein RB653_001127 [Dictyostelium firmibasis]|uniref:Terpene synthase n=1 Tax=Dictyostelium firmibasis TaxID=79012 RepID=A0AAN7TWF9_9MYCE
MIASLSLKDFNFPSDWSVEPNSYDFIDDVYEDSLKFELFKIGDKKSYSWLYHTISCCSYFWNTCKDRENMKLIGHLMNWTFLFDDILDSDKIKDEEAKDMVKRTELLLIEGELPLNPTNLEKYTLWIREECFKVSNGRVDMFNMFLTNSIQWILSIIPLNKTLESKEPVHLELHSYLRKLNVGVELCQGFTYIIYSNNKVDPLIWSNARYKKMLECTSMVVSHVNDVASYCKEVKNGGGAANVLSILQKKNQGDLTMAFKKIVELTNSLVEEFIFHEKKLLSSISIEQQNELKTFIDHLKFLMCGNYLWSFTTGRYASKSSPFIEMRISLNEHLDNTIN